MEISSDQKCEIRTQETQLTIWTIEKTHHRGYATDLPEKTNMAAEQVGGEQGR